MKEFRYFYAPGLPDDQTLPEEEASHCVRVLRLGAGDPVMLTDGKGKIYEGEITVASPRQCLFRIISVREQEKDWCGHLHLAMAPTKNNDRTEWLAEKATEIGFDELTFLHCRFSERKCVKPERFEKILISAMKQSHKAYKPVLNDMVDFQDFIKRDFPGQKFIAHCYDESDIDGSCNEKEYSDKRMDGGKAFLADVLRPDEDALVMIGPEGDFSVEEVRAAISQGFQPISLGRSRLRTETAALVAVHLMNLGHAK